MSRQSISSIAFILMFFCFCFSARAVTGQKPVRKSTPTKSLPQKKRQPAQEAEALVIIEGMTQEMNHLYGVFESAATPQEKYHELQVVKKQFHDDYNALLTKPELSDDRMETPHDYQNILIYFGQLQLDSKGQWTKTGCDYATTMIKLYGYNPGTDTTTINDNDKKALEVLNFVCKR